MDKYLGTVRKVVLSGERGAVRRVNKNLRVFIESSEGFRRTVAIL